MRRRALVSALLVLPVAAVARAAAAQARGKVYRIGILGAFSDNPATQQVFRELERAMATLGWIEGKNYVWERRWAHGDAQKLPSLAAELVGLRPDALVVGTLETALALKNATGTIPIVAIGVGDPVEVGLAKSLARPENVTGPIVAFSELTAKQLELLKQMLPRISRVAALLYAGMSNRDFHMSHASRAADALGLRLEPFEVSKAEDFEPVMKAIRARPADAVLVVASPFMFVQREALAAVALKYGLPTMWNTSVAAEAGGLVAYGADIHALWRRAAVFVDKILRGASPADLPFERPVKFELTINLKTARALGLALPQTVLLRADRAIE
jgi:putative ABC transport system substrate-binding protein